MGNAHRLLFIEQSQQEEIFAGVQLQCSSCSGHIEVTSYVHVLQFDDPSLVTKVSAEELFAGAEAVVDPGHYPTSALHDSKCTDHSNICHTLILDGHMRFASLRDDAQIMCHTEFLTWVKRQNDRSAEYKRVTIMGLLIQTEQQQTILFVEAAHKEFHR